MRVIALPRTPEVRAKVARWSHEAWSADFPGDTEDTYLDLYSQASDDGSLMPYVCVAVDDNERVIGTATLVDDDELSGFETIGPWLAAVWVDTAHRRLGAANAMVEHIENVARAQGHPALHLYTHDQQHWYARHGWETIGQGQLPTHRVTVMRKMF